MSVADAVQASAVEPKLLISGVHSYFAVIAVRSDGIAEVVGSNSTRFIVNYEGATALN
jgi:hypothetical protein